MDKNEFKKFLESVGEVEDLTPKKDPNIRLDDNVEDTVRYGNAWVELTSKINPTLGFKLKRLKPKEKLCELGCGDIIPNQVIERRCHFSPELHWRTKCLACNCYVSPDGEGFIDDPKGITVAYAAYFKNKK
jgi:hypothetical protein